MDNKKPPAFVKPRDQIGKLQSKATLWLADGDVKNTRKMIEKIPDQRDDTDGGSIHIESLKPGQPSTGKIIGESLVKSVDIPIPD